MIIIAMFAGLFICMLALRLPVAISLLVPSLTYLVATGTSVGTAFQQMVFGIDKFVLLAIPLFLLMGNLANIVGVTDKLFGAANAVVGRLRGSYGYINVLVSLGFSWMNGAALADVGAQAKTITPTMVKAGYSQRFSLGVTAASSLIGPIMPPSIPAVIYAMTAGISMGGMLVAGAIPALVITVALMVSVWWISRKWTHLTSPVPGFRNKLILIGRAIPSLMAPVILLGGIIGGYFTPTEAAGIAVAYMVLLGLFYRTINFRSAWKCVRETAESTAGVMIIIASATLFGWILTREGAARILTAFIAERLNNTILFLIVLNLVLLVLGMVMETGSIILIAVPVLLPVTTALGLNPYHLGIIIIFNLMIGLLTPPLGLILYLLEAVTGAKFKTIVSGVLMFAPALILCLILITFIPAISTWLPAAVGF